MRIKYSIAILLAAMPAILFASPAVEVLCIADSDRCTAELQTELGHAFSVRTATLEEAMASLPDIVVTMKDFGEEENYWVIKRLRTIPSHPDIFICGEGEKYAALASRAWTDVIPVAFDGSTRPGKMAEAVKNVIMANGWKNLPRRRIVFAGDSITDGSWGKGDSKPASERDHYDFNHVYGHGYAEKIASALLEKYPERNYKFYNRGIGGGKLQGLSERWEEEILAVKPDIISILIGVNDAPADGSTVDFDKWEAIYRSLLDRALAQNPDCRFVLCTPFSASRGEGFPNEKHLERKKSTDRFDVIVKKIAMDYNAVLVDFSALIDTLIATDRSGDHNYWVWDGVHPTMQGHNKMAELWIKKAKNIL